MQPFDLKRALAGEPVVTRDGREVTKIMYRDYDGGFPVRAKIEGDATSTVFKENGKFWHNNIESKDDLFMKD